MTEPALIGTSSSNRTHSSSSPAQPGATELHAAAGSGRLLLVQQLLSQGADINALDEAGWTPLLHAAANGQRNTVQQLLAAGAAEDAANHDGATALFFAAAKGHADIAEALLSAGASVDAAVIPGHTALMAAAAYGHDGVLKVLLKQQADPNIMMSIEGQGAFALSLAAGRGHQQAVAVLLQAGADVAAADSAGVTALHVAAVKGFTQVVHQLLEGGASVDAANMEGSTALVAATCTGHVSVVDLLLQYKANPDASVMLDSGSMTALFLAAFQGHAQVAQRLLAAGASINAVHLTGSTALGAAVESHKAAVVQVLLAHKKEPVLPQATQAALACALRDSQYAVIAQLQQHLCKVMQSAGLDAAAALAHVYTALQDEGRAVDRCAACMALLQGWAADSAAVDAAGAVCQQRGALAVQAGTRELMVMQEAAQAAASAAEFDVEAEAASFAAGLRLD